MERELSETTGAGFRHEDTDIYNDLEVLAITGSFFQNFKLYKIKGWHFRGSRVMGLEFSYLNPDSGEQMHPGPHIGTDYNDNTDTSEIILDDDEYIQDVKGADSKIIEYLHFRSNKGRYLELGNPNAKNKFRFKLANGQIIISFMLGVGDCLHYILPQSMPLEHLPIAKAPKPVARMNNPIYPTIIKRSQYYGFVLVGSCMHDDFQEFNLHPHVRRKTCRIMRISAVWTSMITGLEITYEINRETRASLYNYSIAAYNEYAATSTNQILKNDFINSIQGTYDEHGITGLILGTHLKNSIIFGHSRGDTFEVKLDDDSEVIAFRGVFTTKGLHGLMVYSV